MNDLQKRTWAEISLPNIRHNYEAIRATLPAGCRFLGVVKADAYGHGAVPVSRLLAFHFGLPVYWAYFGIVSEEIIKLVIFFIRYKSGKWVVNLVA